MILLPKKVLACWVQYPLKLAFALTVHRAQGQKFACVEIDCYSFFSRPVKLA